MQKTTLKKIDLLTRITCFDHYKSRDGHYDIGYHYNAFDEKGEWYWSHNGYIWDEEWSGGHASYEDAEKSLIGRLDKEWEENVKWFEEFDDPDWDIRPKSLVEELPRLKQEYIENSN